MHHKFICFPWNPGSRSGDPGRVVFYHENLKQVAKTQFKNVKRFSQYLEKSKGMSCFGIRKTTQIPLGVMQIWYFFRTIHFFWPSMYGIESWGIFQFSSVPQSLSIYTPPQKKRNFPRCVSFETECMG